LKYYIISGELSGDIHAANLVRALKTLDANAVFAFTGGDHLEAVTGVQPDIHLRKMAFMGFVDVLKNISTIRKNFDKVKASILAFKPDVLLLVDYPGFNLRMAKWAFENGIMCDYYISPTVWAWKENRIETIRKYVNRMMVILPFEEAFYASKGMKVWYPGHPLIDELEHKRQGFSTREQFMQKNSLSGKPIIAVLPGSRKQEIDRMLAIMIETVKKFPDHEFVFAGNAALAPELYAPVKAGGLQLVFDQTHELMWHACAGVIKSGTSTLESALLGLPQVVCYKSGALSFAIGKRLVKVKYISLPNLILDRPLLKELIQKDLTSENIASEINKLLQESNYRKEMLQGYAELHLKLGGPGASARAAKWLWEDVSK
jgi:lipid-A-disaccharide synthase